MSSSTEQRHDARRVLFFLGSGVSYTAGYPSVDQITRSLLDDEWVWTDQNSLLRKASSDSAYPVSEEERNEADNCTGESAAYLQGFLKRLYCDARSLGCDRPNYEMLFDMCKDLENAVLGLNNSPLVHLYARHLKEIGIQPPTDDEWHEDPCAFIERAVAYWTGKPRDPAGLDMLKDAVNDDSVARIDIITLNHDSNIERTLRSWGVDCNCGIVTRDGRQIYDALSLAKSSQRVNLLKLHGSAHACYIIEPCSLQYYPSCADHVQQGHNLTLSVAHGYDILTGTTSKLIAYNAHAADRVLICRLWLSQHNKMLISGYGWCDLAVNLWLLNWFSRAGNVCVWLHKKPYDEVSQHWPVHQQQCFTTALEKGSVRHIQQWLDCAAWGDVKSALTI